MGALYKTRGGFTLIEMSIVLVIIGLIVGGILLGQSLIQAAAVRATVSQIEKYNTATNTFREKFAYLPGDIPAGPAAQFGLTVGSGCTGTLGLSDGNGLIDSWDASSGYWSFQTAGETALFWQDLSSVNLIDGSFQGIGSTGCVKPYSKTQSQLLQYMPAAKIGGGNFIYLYEYGGFNWFGLQVITGTDNNGTMEPNPEETGTLSASITVLQAYNIDKKIDDGLPQHGNVMATYALYWDDTAVPAIAWAGTTGTGATPGSSTTCYDNGNTAGATQQYSLAQNNGNGVNCALSFKMQAGDQ
jgi:prepilin-type N-terminal cleavage/methylation domain-containing protein